MNEGITSEGKCQMKTNTIRKKNHVVKESVQDEVKAIEIKVHYCCDAKKWKRE